MKNQDNKQRLFEVLEKIDPTFKPSAQLLSEWNFDKKKEEDKEETSKKKGEDKEDKEEKKKTSGKKKWNFEKKNDKESEENEDTMQPPDFEKEEHKDKKELKEMDVPVGKKVPVINWDKAKHGNINESDEKWIQNAVNPEHKGYCTPMTKPTCTPRRKALAKRFKGGIEDESYGVPDPLGKNYAKQVNEDEPTGEQPINEPTGNQSIKYRAEVAGVRENTWSTNAKEYNTEEEAKAWLDDLSGRWFGYDMSRVVPITTPTKQPVDIKNDVIYQNFRRK
jgi:hypothetical protein